MPTPLYILVALGGAAIVFFVRPLTLGVILGTAVIAFLLVAILQVLQRPPGLEARVTADQEMS